MTESELDAIVIKIRGRLSPYQNHREDDRALVAAGAASRCLNEPEADVMDCVAMVAHQMAHSCIPNYISPGLNSYLLGSDKDRQLGLLRMFENTREQEFFITPHNHRFNFACCVLQGFVTNTVYHLSDDTEPAGRSMPYRTSEYFKATKTTEVVQSTRWYYRINNRYEVGDWYYMQHQQFHTIHFSHDALVLFLEGCHITDTSYILEPIVDGAAVNTFLVEPWMYNSGA
jgi:hypothetical protein